MNDPENYTIQFGGDGANSILNLLTRAGVRPQFGYRALPSGMEAGYSTSANKVYYRNDNAFPTQSAISHELTHALLDNVYNLSKMHTVDQPNVYDRKKSLMDLYNNIINTPTPVRVQPTQNPDYNEYQKYRYSPDEAPAFGYGNYMDRKNAVEPSPAHIDATKATEIELLKDFYNRYLMSIGR